MIRSFSLADPPVVLPRQQAPPKKEGPGDPLKAAGKLKAFGRKEQK